MLPEQNSNAIVWAGATKLVDVYTPSIPGHLKITPTLRDDIICDPNIGCKIILGLTLDAFQAADLKKAWWTPRVMDSSGLSSGKSTKMFILSNLRCLVIPDHWAVVYYQFFETGQRVFWPNYAKIAAKSAMFRTQIGLIDGTSNSETKGTRKGQSTWTVYFKNSSKLEMPAGGFDRDSISQAGTNTNDLYLDEFTKVEATGSTGIDDQLVGRARRACFNKHHPLWANKIYFLATAEDTMHPSYDRYLSFKKEIERGNPDYVLIQRSYKDYSNLKCDTGKSFKEEFVDNRMIKDMRKGKSINGFMQEALGLWLRNGRGWYTGDLIDRAYEYGNARGAVPITNPMQDWAAMEPKRIQQVRYFLGADPARAESSKAADGALVALRAEPRILGDPRENVIDWLLDFVWAFRIRGADAPQWAAIIHRKNIQFNFDAICMDSQGGGQWIQPELQKEKQMIRGLETVVQPIASIEDEIVAPLHSRFVLSMFKIKDARVQKAWGHMRLSHPTNLVDVAHCEFLTAFKNSVIGFPPKLKNRDMSAQWSQERIHANQMLDLTAEQLMRINVKTDNNGRFEFNNFGAREFGSKGKKDFAYAAKYAFTGFFCWLKTFAEIGIYSKPEDKAQCGSSRSSNGMQAGRIISRPTLQIGRPGRAGVFA